MGIFDIFGDVVKLTESDNVTKLNDVDMSKVTQEEVDEYMESLDIPDNSLMKKLVFLWQKHHTRSLQNSFTIMSNLC